MKIPRMRPRFEIPLDLPPEAALERIKGGLNDRGSACEGAVLDRHVLIAVCARERTFWSPVMDFEILPREGGSVAQGKFGPHPDVWTMFVFLYALESIAAIAGLMYGASQATLGRSPDALWSVGIAAALALLTYGSAFIGQRLGARQMSRLEGFLEATLTPETIDSSAPQA